jgi:DNA replication protein DnaC
MPITTMPCSRACGNDVDLPEAHGIMRGLVAHLADGTIPIVCEACDAAERDADERAANAGEIAARKYSAHLPKKWADQTFADIDRDDLARAVDLAEQWGRGEINGLLLYGHVGRGKSTLAAAAANLRLERQSVRWISVAELLMDLGASMSSERRAHALDRVDVRRTKAALVLDDLDKVNPSEYAVQPLYVAINAWIEADLPLLVTSNRNPTDLERWLPNTFAAPIASRLAGYCKMRDVTGNDRRLET